MSAKSRYHLTTRLDSNGIPLTGPLPTQYVRDSQLVNEVLTKSGTHANSSLDNYVINEIGNVQKVINSNGPGYKINFDTSPLHYKRRIETPVKQTQNITVRYLEPPKPPTPGPIIIKEKRAPAPAPAPPIVIRQIEKAPPTPQPVLIREKPPTPPVKIEPTYIERVLPAPSPPPRQVIVERIKAPPPKPRDIIYEKWLPYRSPGERQVIVEKAPEYRPTSAPKNIIIEYEQRPSSVVEQRFIEDGIYRVDPNEYSRSRPAHEVKYVERINNLPEEYMIRYRSESARKTPKPYEFITVHHRAPSTTDIRTSYDPNETRPKTSFEKRPVGPKFNYTPWNTTYRASYTYKSVERS